MVEKTGLQAVFETKEFQQGLEIYKKGMQDALKITTESTGGMSSAGKELGGIMGTGVSGGAVAAGAALLGVVAIGKQVIEAFMGMVRGIKDFIGESINLASRWVELDMVAQLMGQRVGMTTEEVHALTQELQDAGIRADVASKAIAQFVRMEMSPDLSLALGKVAQDLAVVSKDGADSSETLDRLMLGIQRLSPLILRTAGVNVDLQNSFKDYAATQGIVNRELTQAEKQQAAYNAVLEEGAKVAGAYDIAMESAGKQMRSLSGREIPTLKNAMGAPFQGAFLNVAKAAREVVSSFTEAISEGGALYPMMVRLGAIADIITEALANLATNGTKAVIAFLGNLSSTFGDSVQSAFDWGFELVVNFAQGIIDAAASVLVQAINYLGSILAGWLAPGSPPKVAPDIIKWGVGAMNEYLKGFTSADFGILKSIQSPLKSAFDLMVSTGQKTRKQASEAFLGLTEDIAEALSGGDAGEGLFSKIASQAGQFGNEIADLVRDQFALAGATNEVAAAQERVNEAFEDQQRAEQSVRDLTNEYNRMLRAGASDEMLQAQLAQINASEEQALIAADQKSAAEQELADKQEMLSVLQEQVKLQSELVKQLLDLAKMAIIPGQTIPGGAGGGVGTETPGGGGAGFEIDTSLISDKMKEAVEAAKRAFLEKWEEMKRIVKEKFNEAFGPAIEEVKAAWGDFISVAKQFYDEKLAPTFEAIRLWVTETLPAAWAVFTANLAAVWTFLKTLFVPVLEELWGAISDVWEILTLSLTPAWDLFHQTMGLLYLFIKTFFLKKLGEVGEKFDGLEYLTNLWKLAILALNAGLYLVNAQLKRFRDFLEKIRDLILNMPSYKDVTKQSPVPMAEGLALVNSQMREFRKNLVGTKVAVGELNAMNVSSMINPQVGGTSMISPSRTNVMNLQQQNNIQSPMDLATFRAMFNQVVREQFAGV